MTRAPAAAALLLGFDTARFTPRDTDLLWLDEAR
jgi:hypothetical protein